MNSTLLTGGLMAAVVAGWSQVKSALAWLSSFVVTQANLDEMTSHVMRQEIRTQWRMLPSGQNYYVAKYIMFLGANHATRVPFKLPGSRTVWFRGLQFFFVSDDGNKLHLSYIRGTVNLEALLIKVLKQDEDMLSTLNSRASRFHIVSQMGKDKSMQWDRSDAQLTSTRGDVAPADTSQPRLSVSYDKSFMYDSALWMADAETPSPFRDLYYSDTVMHYVDQARAWLKDRDWYSERGIPHRRGWLLYGPGGTGKTRLAIATAQELGIPVHQFFLSTMSDQEFIKAWQNMETPCMALMEDFDTVFEKRTPVGNTILTFDTVLNMISGAQATNGVFLVVTTNRLDMIDEAMGVDLNGDGVSTRPGRIDTVIEVGNINQKGREALATRVLKDWPDLVAKALQYREATPAQFQEMCLQLALERKHEQDKSATLSLTMKAAA